MNVPEPSADPSEGAPMTTTDKAGQLRPLPAPAAPPLNALREVYEKLLAIEQARLDVAVRIERERGIVFPETSVIVRDVRTLAERLYGPQEPPAQGAAATSPGPVEPSAPSSSPDEGGDDGGEGAAGEVDSFLLELEAQAMAANGSAGGRRGARR